jgi:hypothetical protein
MSLLSKKNIYSILKVARARSLIYMFTYFILQDAMARSDIGMFWDTGVPDR